MLRVCIRTLAFILLCATNFAVASFELGKQYERLPSNIRSSPEVLRLIDENPGKTQVLLFFSYNCHACGLLSQDFDTWSDKQAGKNIVVYRYPVVYNKAYEALARLYYTVTELPNTRALDNAVFTAAQNQNLNLANQDILQQFFVDHGVTADKFTGIYNSFGVDMHIKRARDIGMAFNITATPYVIVNSTTGSYATSWAMAGSKEQLFALLDYLIIKDTVGVATTGAS